MYRPSQQIEGRIARKEYNPSFFSEEKNKQNSVAIHIKNKKLNIQQGTFDGDLELAREAIQSFADTNELTYQSFGHGYGCLTVNGAQHHTNPYGIDMLMMLEFCGIDKSSLIPQIELK